MSSLYTPYSCISPIDQRLVAQRDTLLKQDLDQALMRAAGAQKLWQQLPLEDRQTIVRQATDSLLDDRKAAHEICLSIGRPISQCNGEIKGFAERSHYMNAIAQDSLAPAALTDQHLIANANIADRKILREPIGTLLLIAPWNYPYLTVANTLVPALIAGNAVMLRASRQSLLCAERLVHHFHQAGCPESLLSTLTIDHSLCEQSIAEGLFDQVVFTGSNSAGRSIACAAAQSLTPVVLELGGKDGVYIREDANLAEAIDSVMDGVFFNAGQSCCGIERIFIHERRYDAFIEGAIDWCQQLQLGNPLDPETTLGPVISMVAAQGIQQQKQKAIQEGATPLLGTTGLEVNESLGANYLEPELLTLTRPDMSFMQEEVFGPVAGIMAVSHDDEAIHALNQSPYGLSAALYSEDLVTCETLAKQITTGTVFANRCDYLDPGLPWNGRKASGLGLSLSHLGYLQVTQPKSLHFKKPTKL